VKILSIGVDPGVHGGLAVVALDTLTEEVLAVDLFHLPTYTIGTSTFLDDDALWDLLEELCSSTKFDVVFTTIEKVGAAPADGNRGAFRFGYVSGQVYSALVGMFREQSVTPGLVTPQAWKGRCGLTRAPKDLSRTKAIKLFPELEIDLCRNKDVDKADALWIALVGNNEFRTLALPAMRRRTDAAG